VLNDPRVVALISQFETRGVPQHMRMHREAQVRGFARTGDDLSHSRVRQRSLAFTHKHIWHIRMRARQDTQCSNFWAVEGMGRRQPIFPSADMEDTALQVDLLPAQGHQF